MSLEWQTSARNITFMERALPTAFVPSHHVGIKVDTSGSRWSAAAGVFGRDINDTDPNDRGWGVTGRVTYMPLHHHGMSLHLGLSGAYRETDQKFSQLRFQSRPESHLSEVNFVNSQAIRAVANHQVLGLEAAGVWGPASIQSEYIRTFVERTNGRSNLEFDGWYLYGSYFLTGEARPYYPRRSAFEAISPRWPFLQQGGYRACEVAIRYRHIDLNDATISGGAQGDVTSALNWYPRQHLRVMMNYIDVSTDANPAGRRGRGSDNPSLIEFRFQLDF